MAHDQPAGIGPGDEFIVLAAVDLHLLLVETVPQIVGDDIGAFVEAFGIVDGEGRVGQMRGLRLRHHGRDALSGQPTPGRGQFGQRLAVAIELARLVGRDIGQPIGAGEAAIKIIEATVLRIDDDDGVDLVEAGRGGIGGRKGKQGRTGQTKGSEELGPRHGKTSWLDCGYGAYAAMAREPWAANVDALSPL